MRRRLFLLSLQLLALVDAGMTPAASRSEPGLRFKLRSGVFIIVPCAMGADVKLSCLLDTGTWPTILDTTCATGHGLRQDPGETLSLVDRVVPVSSAVVPRLGLGGMDMGPIPVSVRDLSDLGGVLGLRVDVVLGLDVLRQCSFCIDFKSRSISFAMGAPMKWSEPMCDCGPEPIVVRGEIDGVSVHLLIDTGAPETVLFLDRVKDRLPALTHHSLEPGESCAEAPLFREVTLQHLRIGGWTRKYVKAMGVADPPAGPPPVDGLLSLTTLGCTSYCFDTKRKVVSWR